MSYELKSSVLSLNRIQLSTFRWFIFFFPVGKITVYQRSHLSYLPRKDLQPLHPPPPMAQFTQQLRLGASITARKMVLMSRAFLFMLACLFCWFFFFVVVVLALNELPLFFFKLPSWSLSHFPRSLSALAKDLSAQDGLEVLLFLLQGLPFRQRPKLDKSSGRSRA